MERQERMEEDLCFFTAEWQPLGNSTSYSTRAASLDCTLFSMDKKCNYSQNAIILIIVKPDTKNIQNSEVYKTYQN